MSKDRTVGEIVEQVMASIPEEHKDSFKSVLDSLLYCAPEAINVWFNRFLKVFNQVVPCPPIDDWHFVAVAALTRQSIEDVRKQFTAGGIELNEP